MRAGAGNPVAWTVKLAFLPCLKVALAGEVIFGALPAANFSLKPLVTGLP